MVDKIICARCENIIKEKTYMIFKNFYDEGCYKTELKERKLQLEIKCNCGKIFTDDATFEEHYKTHYVMTKKEKMDEIHEDTQGLIDKSLLKF